MNDQLTAREVFAMRRDGRLEEALSAARQLYASEASNVWSLKALLYCLISAVWESQDQAARGDLADELRGLPAVPGDEELAERRTKACKLADPVSQELRRIREISKAQRHPEALRELRQLRENNPDLADVGIALGWELWHALRTEIHGDDPRAGTVRSLLLEYAGLPADRSPELHSRILDMAARAAQKDLFPSFCGFVKWWDPSCLRDSDFEPNQSQGGDTFPSVVEHVIQGLGHAVKEEEDPSLIALAVDFIREHYGRFPEQEWFPYYLAVALLRAGNGTEAEELLLPIVRKKQTEYWAWQQLADCLEYDDPNRLACLCKSVLCPAKGPEFLLAVRLSLAEALLSAGKAAEAKHELTQIATLRQEHGWRMKGRLAELMEQPWFEQTEARDGSKEYRALAANADALLSSGLPGYDAVVGATGVKIGRKQNDFVIFDVRLDDGRVESMPVPVKVLGNMKGLRPGAPVRVRIDESTERPRIVGVEERVADAWDILPAIVGIVARINESKGMSVVLSTEGTESACYHSDVQGAAAYASGSFVKCRVVQDRSRTKVRHIETAEASLDSEHWQEFNGAFRAREKGGGHVQDVFVPQRLSGDAQDGDVISGLAVRQRDRDTDRTWWCAVSLRGPAASTDERRD